MATALKSEFHETRTERLVVLVSPTEKRAIEAKAREAKASLSDFVRNAAQGYVEPTDTEKALIQDLIAHIDGTDERIEATLARIDELNVNETAFDEDVYKAELTARWTSADGSPNYDVMRADLAERASAA